MSAGDRRKRLFGRGYESAAVPIRTDIARMIQEGDVTSITSLSLIRSYSLHTLLSQCCT